MNLFVCLCFYFVNISRVIGREGWLFCTSREIGWIDRLQVTYVSRLETDVRQYYSYLLHLLYIVTARALFLRILLIPMYFNPVVAS